MVDKVYEEVIAEILQELDTQHAMYQSFYNKYYGCDDFNSKHIHYLLVEMCKRIRKEIILRERK